MGNSAPSELTLGVYPSILVNDNHNCHHPGNDALLKFKEVCVSTVPMKSG